jgi:GntR family transcriptional regulator of arabinose operon
MSETLKSQPEPGTLYQYLVTTLRDRIEGGRLSPGERLPSINNLCAEYGVSSITVRTALKELVRSGHIESRARSGFFVRASSLPPTPALTGDQVIALLVPFRGSHPFFGGIIAGAEDQCRRLGYRLVVAASNDNLEQEGEQLRDLARLVAGVMVVPITLDGNYASYTLLLERSVPFVFVDCYVRHLAVPVVTTDNEKGGYLATQHLLSTGVQQVYLVSERPATSLEERIRGYRRALKEAGVPFEPSLLREGPLAGPASGYDLTRKLLQSTQIPKPFGIFAVHDGVAQGCLAALKEAGLSVPQDVRLVGYDDTYSLQIDPPLTTIRQNTEGMGENAVRLLVKMIQQGTDAPVPRSTRLTPELLVRSSSDPNSSFSLAEHFARRAANELAPRSARETAIVAK